MEQRLYRGKISLNSEDLLELSASHEHHLVEDDLSKDEIICVLVSMLEAHQWDSATKFCYFTNPAVRNIPESTCLQSGRWLCKRTMKRNASYKVLASFPSIFTVLKDVQ